ncbi:hypothetical protein DR64_1372 [Paraburkholderia xenovorans LB400]|uniref:DUF2844 domain-containing protein n=1 Tax=Paraburkholderia xenovorans (strain LB400) TaxID=266265 RepID=Q144D1_PARXL|nr:DUF2844 domain-containing protein [Paraburkholderia xenovorans]ABE29308.1 Conserved hypothetical protein [Paraburkholderia xenovorans LB400]AIP31611.1 hypothetical protein DR64_1372 [Paraburkholderia xenovorans LB400]EIF32751.1 Protein of unknown function (DUF2844) [Burkholderia sp. Ch1-1]NPT39689.1 DUF2844 domain-containing protein [Paraburkholderia xenovorans]
MKFAKVALAAAALLPLASYAALGGAPGAGSAPQPLFRAATSNAASTAAAYTVRASRDANGVTVREYVLPANVVFAVTWDGPVRPDMSALLGSYFPNAVAASAARARGTGPLIERNGDFQIESAGAPGHASGKAFLPRLVPANVRVEDLQ